MKRLLPLLLAATFLGALPAAAQVPEIAFDSAANPLSLPDDVYLGEAAGVATNSKGDIFVYTRTGHPTLTIGAARGFVHGGSRLFQFDRNGKFVREIGKDSYAFVFAQQVRIDPQDNIWIVDQMTNTVLKFDPEGRVMMILGRKPEAVTVPVRPLAAPAAGQVAGAGAPTDIFNRPTDVAWDGAGNIYVSDGLNNARVAKFNKNGVFIKSWGAKGNERAISAPPARSRSMPAAPSMSATAATSASRSSTATEPSRPSTPMSETRRRSASRPAPTRCSTARTRIRRPTSTSPAKSTRCAWTARSSASSAAPASCRRSSAPSTPSTAAARRRSTWARSAICGCRS